MNIVLHYVGTCCTQDRITMISANLILNHLLFSIICCAFADRTEARVAATKAEVPKWQTLTTEQRWQILSQENIYYLEWLVKEYLGMGIMEWMDFRSYRPDPDQMVETVLEALRLREEKTAHRRQQQQQSR